MDDWLAMRSDWDNGFISLIAFRCKCAWIAIKDT